MHWEHGLDQSFNYTEFIPSPASCTTILSLLVFDLGGDWTAVQFFCLFVWFLLLFIFEFNSGRAAGMQTPRKHAGVWVFSQLYCFLYCSFLKQICQNPVLFALVLEWALPDFDVFCRPTYRISSADFSWCHRLSLPRLACSSTCPPQARQPAQIWKRLHLSAPPHEGLVSLWNQFIKFSSVYCSPLAPWTSIFILYIFFSLLL